MQPYKILVVDDNADYLARIIDLLNETDESFTFFQAFNGKIACSVAEKKLPDLIITDWEMPVMDGIEFVKYLKSKEITKDIPVIMCTGVMTEVENLKTALDAGAVDYIRKPVEKQELIARVHSMLKLSQSIKKIKEQNQILLQQKEEIQLQATSLKNALDAVEYERTRSEKLLLNVLPFSVANELKENGKVESKYFKKATVLFADFKGFTKLSEQLSPQDIVDLINHCFGSFDTFCKNANVEKIKTIGDSYMCAGGIPVSNETNPIDVVMLALQIQRFMAQWKKDRESANLPVWELRIGIHTGELIAGVVGTDKFAYDIWGDTVNTASRMESSGEAGMINISETTYELVKEHFICTYRGEIPAKSKGNIKMYFVMGEK